MSKARPRAKQREDDIVLELLKGQTPVQRGKPAKGKRAPSKTVREVVRGASAVKALIERSRLLTEMTKGKSKRKPK